MPSTLSIETVRRRFPEARMLDGRNGIEFVVTCPFKHKKGGIYKMNINSETGVYHCHDCENAGDAIEKWFDPASEMVAKYRFKRDSEDERARMLHMIRGRSGGGMKNQIDAPGIIVPMSELPDEHVSWQYLKDRGLDTEEIRNYSREVALSYCVKSNIKTAGSGTNSGRIIFPVYMRGVLVGWQARQIEEKICNPDGSPLYKRVWQGDERGWVDYEWIPDEEKFKDQVLGIPKYNSARGFSRTQCLYNFDIAVRNRDLVVIVEGPVDQVSVGPRAVATFGGASDSQMKMIVNNWYFVVILRDPNIDPQGGKFQNTLRQLSDIPTVHLSLPDGKDPGATKRSVIWQCIAEQLRKENYSIPTGIL